MPKNFTSCGGFNPLMIPQTGKSTVQRSADRTVYGTACAGLDCLRYRQGKHHFRFRLHDLSAKIGKADGWILTLTY